MTSFESECEDDKEANDEDVRGNWERCVNFLLTDKKKRLGGWGRFPYHLIAYLYFRNESNERDKFNPTKSQKFNLTDGNQPIRNFTIFCHFVLKLKRSQRDEAYKKGDLFSFKRSLTPKKVNGEIVPLCEPFEKLRKRLNITGFGITKDKNKKI